MSQIFILPFQKRTHLWMKIAKLTHNHEKCHRDDWWFVPNRHVSNIANEVMCTYATR